jgi:hypothetical protein
LIWTSGFDYIGKKGRIRYIIAGWSSLKSKGEKMQKRLKIKKSQVLLTAIEGLGSGAFGLFLVHLTGLVFLGYLGGAVMFCLGVWVLIKIQDEQDNRYGYLDLALYFLSLVWIALAYHWIISVILFLAFIFVGLRVDPVDPELLKSKPIVRKT